MPRDGSGVAQVIPGADSVASNTTILSSLHNSTIGDIYNLFNTQWPVALGGTGGTTAIGAWDSIGAAEETVASAATLVLTGLTKPFFNISGTTGVTAVTMTAGTVRFARMQGAVTFTASATLIINGLTNATSSTYTTRANDILMFEGYSSSTVRMWIISDHPLVVGGDIAIASSINITGSGTVHNLTGSGTITGIVGSSAEQVKLIRTNGSATFTASGTLTINGVTTGSFTPVVDTFILVRATASSANLYIPSGGMFMANGQIAFPATPNPSSNDTTLDAYKEGTWTPGISFGAGTTGITYGSRGGAYTKVGNAIILRGSLALTSKGSSTGQARITGIPISLSGNWLSTIPFYTNMSSVSGVLGIITDNGGGNTTADITVGGTTGIANASDTNFSNTTFIAFTIVAQTTA